MEQITDIVEARGMTTLLATHDIDAAIRLADVVYVLSDGPAGCSLGSRSPIRGGG